MPNCVFTPNLEHSQSLLFNCIKNFIHIILILWSLMFSIFNFLCSRILPHLLNQVSIPFHSQNIWFTSCPSSKTHSQILAMYFLLSSPCHVCHTELSIQTQCQKEAVGGGKSVLPGFRPKCDSNGDYLAQQCWDGTDICWCVDKNGNEKTDSVTRGTAECETAKLGMSWTFMLISDIWNVSHCFILHTHA